jgi:Ras-related GTP-binding protein A/B
MIFVFDIESREFAADVINYGNIIRALEECSPGAKVFCLIHKMDLVQPGFKHSLFEQRAEHIRAASESFKETVDFFPTSIWDQSLYRAWTQIIYFLIPNAKSIETMLEQLAEGIHARELILYERTTCLMVTHITRGTEVQNPFTDRFERISSILKTHKHSMAQVTRLVCHDASTDYFDSKHLGLPAGSANFAELHIKTGRFMFFITRLTENTNLAVSIPPYEHIFNAARINIGMVRSKFADLEIATKKKPELEPKASSENSNSN